MHGPAGDSVFNPVPVFVELRGAPDHVMKDIPPADRLSTRPSLIVNIIHLNNLNRFHIAVFIQTNRHSVDLTPPVRGPGQLGYRIRFHDQVRLTGCPFQAVIEYQRFRSIGRVPLRRAGSCPGRDGRKLRLAQRRVILIALDPHVFFHIPRRHGTCPVT